MQDRKRERCGFSSACLRTTQEIAPLEDVRNGLGLDGCRNGVSFGSDRAKDGLSEPQISKFHGQKLLESRDIQASGGLAPGIRK